MVAAILLFLLSLLLGSGQGGPQSQPLGMPEILAFASVIYFGWTVMVMMSVAGTAAIKGLNAGMMLKKMAVFGPIPYLF